MAEVGENNTYKLIFSGLEGRELPLKTVIPSYKLAVRFERQPYTLEDKTVVQALWRSTWGGRSREVKNHSTPLGCNTLDIKRYRGVFCDGEGVLTLGFVRVLDLNRTANHCTLFPVR